MLMFLTSESSSSIYGYVNVSLICSSDN